MSEESGRTFSIIMVAQLPDGRFGVIPKNLQPGKCRLIVDLSHPKGKSVNDGIPKHLCSLKYITLEDAVQQILTLSPGALLAKIDIKCAFRLFRFLSPLWPTICPQTLQHTGRSFGMDSATRRSLTLSPLP